MLNRNEQIVSALDLIKENSNFGVKGVVLLQLMDHNPHDSVKLAALLVSTAGNANKAVAGLVELGLLQLTKSEEGESSKGRPAENLYSTTDKGREFLVSIGVDLDGEHGLRTIEGYANGLKVIKGYSNFGIKSLVLMQLMEYGRFDSAQISKLLVVSAGNANKALANLVSQKLVTMTKDESRAHSKGRPAENVYVTTSSGQAFMRDLGIQVPEGIEKHDGLEKAA